MTHFTADNCVDDRPGHHTRGPANVEEAVADNRSDQGREEDQHCQRCRLPRILVTSLNVLEE